MSLRTTVGAAIAALLITTAAPAATITAERDGCNPKDCYKIKIVGNIQQKDFMTFEKVVKDNQIKVAIVYLDSDGGLLVSGLIMGLMIHKFGFETVVDADAYCVSVCASMWLAGSKKYTAQTAHVGFHQPYYKDRRGRPHVDPKTIGLMKSYYREIGVPKPAADFFLTADPRDAYWLNKDLAKGFGIEVTIIKVEEQTTSKFEEGTAATLPKEFIEQLTSKKPL
jgi:hypothetical protein